MDDMDLGFKTGVSGAVYQLLSGAIKSFFPIVFFLVNIGFSFMLTLIHSTFVWVLKKVKVNFSIDETFFTNNTTQFGKIIEAFRGTMEKIALMVIILIVLWQLIKSLFSYMGFETDEAIKIAGRAIIFSIIIFYSQDIIVWIINKIYSPMVDKLFELLYDAEVMGIKKNMTLSKMITIILTNVASSLRIDKATVESLGSFAGLIQGLILIYIDFNVLILLAKFAEKTVVFLLIIIIAPVAMACGVSKNTKHIFEGWVKTFLGVLVTYMLYNVILIMVILFMFLQSGGTILIGSKAYRFIGNTSFVYATGVILGTFALMDQVETIARGLGFNTGGASISVSSGISAIVSTYYGVANIAIPVVKGARKIGKFGVAGEKYMYNKVDDELAKRNLGKYIKTLNEVDKYKDNPNSKKLKSLNKKLDKLGKKTHALQFGVFMKGEDIREKAKELGGKRQLAKQLKGLKKESDAKSEIDSIQSKINNAKDRIKELQSSKVRGANGEIARLKAEIGANEDKIAVIKNRLIKTYNANIKSYGKKVDGIGKLIEKNKDKLGKVTDPKERQKLNVENQYLVKKQLYYKSNIDNFNKSRNEYIEKYGDFAGSKIKKRAKSLIKLSTYDNVIKKGSKYAVKKGIPSLIAMGARGGGNDLMRVLMKEVSKDKKKLQEWYGNGGKEELEVFQKTLQYTTGKALKASVLPFTLQADAVKNLAVATKRVTSGVWHKAAGSKNGQIEVSTIMKDMLTPSISSNIMNGGWSREYVRIMNSSDTVEGNLVLNYRDSENKKQRLQEKLDNLKEKEEPLNDVEQKRMEKLQNDIERENKRMEKSRKQARARMEKYENQREKLKSEISQKEQENEIKRNEERSYMTKANEDKYSKQQNEIQRMQNKLDKLDEKIEYLKEIAGDGPVSAQYKVPSIHNKGQASITYDISSDDKTSEE